MSAGEQEPGLASITFLTGPLAGKTFLISKPTITIGRGAKNDINIKADLEVSRVHARLRLEAGAWTIENISEGNALTVNGAPVEQGPVEDQATVGLGNVTTFRLSSHATAQAIVDETLPMGLEQAAPADAKPKTSETLVRVGPPASKMAEEAPAAAEEQTLALAMPGAPASSEQMLDQDRPSEPLSRVSQTLIGVASAIGIPTLEV